VKLSERIRKTRKDAGISQEELARRAGIGFAAVSRLERGVSHDPHYSTLLNLADALGVPVEALIREEDRSEDPLTAGVA
jgi:transcriptional regulator with XRE-family HTH domain